MVNGILIETEDETNSNPTASDKGFFSGRARVTIARSEDAVFAASPPDEGTSRERMDRFGVSDGIGVFSAFFACSAILNSTCRRFTGVEEIRRA